MKRLGKTELMSRKPFSSLCWRKLLPATETDMGALFRLSCLNPFTSTSDSVWCWTIVESAVSASAFKGRNAAHRKRNYFMFLFYMKYFAKLQAFNKFHNHHLLGNENMHIIAWNTANESQICYKWHYELHVSAPQVLCFFGAIHHIFWREKIWIMTQNE